MDLTSSISKKIDRSFKFCPPKFHINVAPKSDSYSIESRNHGNHHYNTNDYNYSLLCYNESITCAVSNEIKSLSYANRSAAYFELNLYDQCIKNIQWARENNYPQSKMHKLNEREEKCRQLMNQKVIPNTKILDSFKLSYPANKKLPFLADCIEMDKNTRKIITKRNLKAGDIICVEDPAVHFLRNSALFERCSNCYEKYFTNLIPCNKTASMMFCSTDCMECFYSKVININDILCDDVKLLSEMSAAFGGLDEFRSYMEETTEFNHTIFDFDLSDPKDPEYNKNRMKCVLGLAKKYSYSTDEKTCKIQKYVSKEISDKLLEILMSNLPRQSSLCPLNPTEEAVIPLFASILKHSCLPNVFTYNISNKVVTIVIKPIKKGEELLYSHFNQYGHALKDHPNPAATIMKFKCKCQVCLNDNYTLFPSPISSEPDIISIDEALSCIKEAWEIINKKSLKDYAISYMLEKIKLALEQIAMHSDYTFGNRCDVFKDPSIFFYNIL